MRTDDMTGAGERTAPDIDPLLFRRTMGCFATGVTVITARDGTGYRGMTANAFMSGSLSPPLCVVSIAKRAHMHALLLSAEAFGVSILAEDQEDASTHFAGRGAPDFSPAMDESGQVPLLVGASARISASMAARHDCGDHTLFIGRILTMEASGRRPLLYHAGSYASLARPGAAHHVPAPEFW
jgi:flavin reductase (DIM6/NTAB) family NADH-FMN oxidoreductase RutF